MMVGSNNMPNGSIDMANTMMPNGRPVKPLPPGNYQVVGIDIDTTGRRLIDEIVQLAAFTPNDHFEQYIMPYMNLNPAARQRHQVRVISIGFYRMLKSMHTYKIIKSKTEIAALKDFLDWLEAMKAKDPKSNGIILVYHEERKFIPYMILESLKKYNLLDRFLLTVKSFVNSLNLAKTNVNEQWQHYSLRKLSKVLSSKASSDANNNSGGNGNGSEANGNDQQQPNQDNTSGQPQFNQSRAQNRQQQHSQGRDVFDGSASVRAKLTYEVTLQLANQESQDPIDSPQAIKRMLNALQPFAQPVDCDLNELQTQNENLERQNSFRPVFLNYFKTTIYHRVRAVKFRIILAEQGYDLQTMNAIWNERQKEGLIEILQPIEDLKTDDKNELADLFDSYFDPSKVTIKPVVRNNNSRRRNRRGMRMNSKYDGNNNNRRSNEQGAGGDKQIPSGGGNNMPDSTTKSPVPMANGMKPQRGRRNPRSRNNSKSKPNSLNSGNNNNANQMSNAAAPQTTAVA